jgi:hypothetical protein
VAFEPERVVPVELEEVAVVVEVLRQDLRVGHALQRRVPEQMIEMVRLLQELKLLSE